MNKLNFSDDPYMSMAVQTILIRHRNQFNSPFNPMKESAFIKEMSQQILVQADHFKQITETALKNLTTTDCDHS